MAVPNIGEGERGRAKHSRLCARISKTDHGGVGTLEGDGENYRELKFTDRDQCFH
jgi:hypothetical protein